MANLSNQNPNVAYGLNAPGVQAFQRPIIATRNPTTSDKAPLGTLWIVPSTNSGFLLVAVVNNTATWSSFSGGSGTFTTINATTGNITTVNATTVNATTVAATGAVSGASVTATGAVSGATVAATTTVTAGTTIKAAGDVAGTAGSTSVSNVTNTTQGAGALSILSTNGNAGNNAGFIKIYVGTTTAWVPYYTNIAP